MNLLSRERAGDIYFTGLLLLCAALPLSLFAISIAQFVIAVSFLTERKYRQRLQQFLHNLPALAITGIYIMHLVGLIWTADFAWAKHDLIVKLPLLTLPFLISTAPPLNKNKFETLLSVFILAMVAGSLISSAVLAGIIKHQVNDIRDIFIFHISHIRFALLTCVAIFSSAYFFFVNRHRWSGLKKAITVLTAVWLILFLVIGESVTGLLILFTAALIICIYFLFRNKSPRINELISLFLVAAASLAFYFLHDIYKESTVVHPVNLKNLDANTRNGNPYANYVLETQTENGYLVWIYLCEKELREEWNKRSKINYDSLDTRKQMVKFTLIRFLTSKGLRKDADGVQSLSDDEIHSIEHGIANVNFQGKSNLRARFLQLFSEYKIFVEGGDPSGYSVAQRLEYWKAAWEIFSENIFFGVGTGDIVNAFPPQYEKMHTRLLPQLRLRAHNQYLTFAATFGIFGLLYFLFSLIYPMLALKKSRDFLYISFWLIAALSMISEDTLETQAGVTFFTFFNCLFLFARHDGD